MDAGVLRGLFTLVMLAAFAGVAAWAWSHKRKGDFDAAAQLPLEDDEEQAGSDRQGR